MSIYISQQDRIIANVDPELKELVKDDSRFTSANGHAGFPDSFKDTSFKEGGLQLSFTKDGLGVEVDTDIHNFNYSGSKGDESKAKIGHGLEVIGNALAGRKTNPYVIFDILKSRTTDGRFKPHYDLRTVLRK